MGWFRLGMVVVACLWSMDARAGGLLQPSDYTAIASTMTESGGYDVNTSGATPTIVLPDGTVLNGVLDPTGQIAVFTFGSIDLGAGSNSTIFVNGDRAVAILSQGGFTVAGSFVTDISATNATPSSASTPGPGGFADGGPGMGGGNLLSGGGGGYGGAGGAGGPGNYAGEGPPPFGGTGYYPGGTGGSTYGLTTPGLIGGSSGASAGLPIFGFVGPPGAGGGAIELGASGSLNLVGQVGIQANGGNGSYTSGGGSGGEVAFLGQSVNLSGVTVSAQGGYGGPATTVPGPSGWDFGYGGYGGGGLVQIESNDINLGSSTFNLSGANNGQIVEFAGVPEPSSLVMAGIAAAVGLATALARRRSRATA